MKRQARLHIHQVGSPAWISTLRFVDLVPGCFDFRVLCLDELGSIETHRTRTGSLSAVRPRCGQCDSDSIRLRQRNGKVELSQESHRLTETSRSYYPFSSVGHSVEPEPQMPYKYCGFSKLEKYRGGEGGIRTLVRVSPKHAFQACALSRSATSPQKRFRRQRP